MHRRLRDEEDGFTILEVVIAMSVLAMASIGFATTAGVGLRLIGTSNERQTGVQVVNESMETARATPYTGLILDSAVAFEGAGTPDEDVVGTTYGGEELVVGAGGAFDHRVTSELNGATYEVYRYITWVPSDDGTDLQAYKRVTVVAQWDGGGAGSAPSRLSQSTIISSDGVSWVLAPLEGGSGVPPTTTTTDPSTTTTTTALPLCESDGTGPTGSLTILAGTGANTGYTSSSTVNLSLTASDPCTPLEMAFSNDGSTWSADEPFAVGKAWPLAPGDGDRTVWVRYQDAGDNASVAQASVRVDGTPPATPGAFTATAEKNPWRVVLTWRPSTDNDVVIGYRIYVKPKNGSYQNQSTGVMHPCNTTPCSWTHTGVKNNDIYTYYVVAYDAAGNESSRTGETTVTV